MLPVFEGADPYLSWTKPAYGSAQRAEKTTEILERARAEQASSTGRPFVGSMVFSEGARVALGLLLQQQQQDVEGKQKKDDRFLFGVFLMGISPPLMATSSPFDGIRRISIPTVHVLGTSDLWRRSSTELWQTCSEQAIAKLIELPVGHQLPVLREDTWVADAIFCFTRNQPP